MGWERLVSEKQHMCHVYYRNENNMSKSVLVMLVDYNYSALGPDLSKLTCCSGSGGAC